MNNYIVWKRSNETHTCNSFQICKLFEKKGKVIEVDKRSGLNTSNNKDSKTLRSTDYLLFCGSIQQFVSLPSTLKVLAFYFNRKVLTDILFSCCQENHMVVCPSFVFQGCIKKKKPPKQANSFLFFFFFFFLSCKGIFGAKCFMLFFGQRVLAA